MIPILQWDLVDHLHWLTQQQFLDGIQLSFITSDPITITATFVGYWLNELNEIERGSAIKGLDLHSAYPGVHLFYPVLAKN